MSDHHQDNQNSLCIVNSVISFCHGFVVSIKHSKQKSAADVGFPRLQRPAVHILSVITYISDYMRL